MGILYLVATPIGNMEDIAVRAIKTLFSVDIILCEDTRRTGLLLKNLENKYSLMIQIIRVKRRKLISFYDENEARRIPEIIGLLEQGLNTALVSDSGTPLIADPGFKLVRECLKRKIKVVSIPGPSSVLTALISSGLPSDQFLFLGYLPSNQMRRNRLLKDLKTLISLSIIHPTIIFFESPHRLNKSLSAIKDIFCDTEIVICRELTKIYEEIWRGKISEAITYFKQPKGEFVLIFSIPQTLYTPGVM